MIKRFATMAEVIDVLGNQARKERDCQVCGARRVTVYPLLSLLACAPCIVVQTNAQD